MTGCLASLAAVAASPGSACTVQEAKSKAAEVSVKIRALSRSDPAQAAQLEERAANGKRVTNAEAACRIYDDVLSKLDAVR